MRKRYTVIAAIAAMSMLMTIPAYAGNWKEVSGKWMYQRSSEKYAREEWLNVDGKTYYIGSDGYMVTGWKQLNNQWYYMDANGVMQTGWIQVDGSWYYMIPNEGSMAKNTTIDGYWLGSDGVWTGSASLTGLLDPVSTIDATSFSLVQNMLDGLSSSSYTILASGKTGGSNETWTNSIRLAGKGSYVEYSTGGQYSLLAGTLSPSTVFDNGVLGKITVYGDNNQVLYSSPDIHHNEKPIPFAVDVDGQNSVRVEFSYVTGDPLKKPAMLFKNLRLYR